MSMRSLAAKEMIQLSSPILTVGTRQNVALLNVPSGSATIPVLQAAQDGLVDVASGGDTDALAETVRGLVVEHDALVNRIGLRLDAEVAMASSDAEVAAVQHARDQILPPGESILRMSTAAKAGEHLVREHRVSAETITLLGTMPLRGGGTLADTYRQLQSTSVELSTADSHRQGVLAEQAGPRMREARKRWVAAIELIDMSMSAVGADPTPVLGAIRAAQARTDGESSDATPAAPATPATPATPAATPATTPAPAAAAGATPSPATPHA